MCICVFTGLSNKAFVLHVFLLYGYRIASSFPYLIYMLYVSKIMLRINKKEKWIYRSPVSRAQLNILNFFSWSILLRQLQHSLQCSFTNIQYALLNFVVLRGRYTEPFAFHNEIWQQPPSHSDPMNTQYYFSRSAHTQSVCTSQWQRPGQNGWRTYGFPDVKGGGGQRCENSVSFFLQQMLNDDM